MTADVRLSQAAMTLTLAANTIRDTPEVAAAIDEIGNPEFVARVLTTAARSLSTSTYLRPVWSAERPIPLGTQEIKP